MLRELLRTLQTIGQKQWVALTLSFLLSASTCTWPLWCWWTDPLAASTDTLLAKEKLVYTHAVIKWKLAASFRIKHFAIVQVLKTSTKSFQILRANFFSLKRISQKQAKKCSANTVSTLQMYLLLGTGLCLANSVTITLSQTLLLLISANLRWPHAPILPTGVQLL